MRLKYQLFITLLIASALLVALMFAVSSLSFSRAFLGYINNAERQHAQTLVLELEQLYARDGSWEPVTANPKLFRSLLRSSRDHHRLQRENNKGPRHRGNLPPIPPSERILKRLALTDTSKQALLGQINISKKTDWYPINHNEELVGYIGLNKLKRLDNQIDRAFEKQQRKSFALAGLAMVLLSSILAAPLTSRLVKPILKVKKTIAQLSDGNFSNRISTTRRDEIGELSRDINRLGATLEKNKKARQKYFAEISHELRTPVGVLQAELEALQDGIRPLDQLAIDSLHTEVSRLKRLIEDLQTLSLADAGALDYQMQLLDLKLCVEGVLDRHKQANPELNIQITSPQGKLLVNGDEQRLGQLLDNLFQNTTRYTRLPGELQIIMTTENNSVTLTWQDSAPGVSSDALEKLFDPLFRTEVSRNREHGGSGLGLSIVKKIVDAHNGTCSAHHSDLGGLNITLTFPDAGPI